MAVVVILLLFLALYRFSPYRSRPEGYECLVARVRGVTTISSFHGRTRAVFEHDSKDSSDSRACHAADLQPFRKSLPSGCRSFQAKESAAGFTKRLFFWRMLSDGFSFAALRADVFRVSRRRVVSAYRPAACRCP